MRRYCIERQQRAGGDITKNEVSPMTMNFSLPHRLHCQSDALDGIGHLSYVVTMSCEPE